MSVKDDLTRTFAVIHTEIVAVGVNSTENRRGDLVNRCHQSDGIVNGSCLKIFSVSLGNDDRVTSTDGVNVQECEGRFVFVYFVARDGTGDDGAEETRHSFIFLRKE